MKADGNWKTENRFDFEKLMLITPSELTEFYSKGEILSKMFFNLMRSQH
jgi:hypothetical protein